MTELPTNTGKLRDVAATKHRRGAVRVVRRSIVVSSVVTLVAVVMLAAPTVGPSTSSPPPVNLQRVMLSKQPEPVGWAAGVNVSTDLVAVKWSGDPGSRFVVSTRDARGRWSRPTTLDAVDTGPDPGTHEAAQATMSASEPLWVRASTGVRVTLASGHGANVELNAIKAPAPKVPSSSASAFPAWPGIISRSQWGADESLRFRYCSGPSYSSSVKFAVVHHTVESNNYSPSDSFAIVRSIYAYSVLTLHYCDMMYNFLVDKYGQVFEGRFGGADKPVLGAHAIGFNTSSTGVAMIGDYSTASPTAASVDAIERLLAWKFGASGVDPRAPVNYTTTGNDKFASGTNLTFPPIIGHRDTWFTSCPGSALYALLPQIRESVAQRIELAPPETFSWWRPQAGAPRMTVVSAYGGMFPAGGATMPPLGAYWPAFGIAKAVTYLPHGAGGYVLDGYGGLHPWGAAPPASGGYWPGFNIARDVVELPDGTGGYVLDGWGGIHAFGAAHPLPPSAYWRGFDIARRLVLLPGGHSGYVLDGWGGVHPVGGAPRLSGGHFWRGWDIARDLVVRPGTSDVYLLDGFGAVWPLGGAPSLRAPYYGTDVARGLVLLPGQGGYTLTKTGTLDPFDGAHTVLQGRATIAPPNAVAVAFTP